MRSFIQDVVVAAQEFPTDCSEARSATPIVDRAGKRPTPICAVRETYRLQERLLMMRDVVMYKNCSM
jgi:hypothetical protein